MSSAEYAAKIKEFETAKQEVNGLKDSLGDCQSSASKGVTIMENLTICGEPMDQGKISDASDKLESISDDFDTIIKECDKLITEYQKKYEAALAAEEEARKKQTSS